MKKKKEKPTKKQKKLTARSPEAFPKLTIYPDGWDLEHLTSNAEKAKPRRAKRKHRVKTFPDTTDAIL